MQALSAGVSHAPTRQLTTASPHQFMFTLIFAFTNARDARWAGHPGVLKADLASLGVPIDYGTVLAGGDCGGDCSGFAKAGLVFRNVSMVLSRWPNVDNVTGRCEHPPLTVCKPVTRL
jgi:hypothetical protein